MMRAVGAVMAWLLAASAAHAVGGPVVRVHVDAKAPILVGQQVKIEVQVLVPNFFMSPPRFPSLDIPGAVVTMPDESGVNLNDKIGGEDYAGIQKTYVFVAQQAGEFTLPPARITFKYAAVPGKATDGVVALPPQKITVALPAGAPAGVPAGPVARVTITQALDRGVEGLVAGDALTRTVEVFAERTPAMMIPPPRFDAPAGVRAYPRDPVLRDETVDRVGFVGGRRTDTVTYVFGTAGDFTLPAIEIAWLDPATGKQQVARAPAIQVSVAPNPGFKPAIAPEAPPEAAPMPAPPPRFDWTTWLDRIAALAVAGAVLAWLAHRYRPRYRGWAAARRHRREEAEPAYFARVQAACTAGDAPRAYDALVRWARRAGAPAIARWCRDGSADEASTEIEELERYLYSATSDARHWDGRPLAAALVAARKTWLRSKARPGSRGAELPALNP